MNRPPLSRPSSMPLLGLLVFSCGWVSCGKDGSNPVKPTTNTAPKISSATLHPSLVPFSGSATLDVRAEDPEGGAVRLAATAQHGIVTASAGGSPTGAWSAIYQHDGTSDSDEITITATDASNAAATMTLPVSIAPPPNKAPVAAISGPSTGEVGQSLTFDGKRSHDPDGSVTGYAWSFGDGAAASGLAVTHTYLQPGEYRVTLQVTDDDGETASAALGVTITKSPEPPPPPPPPTPQPAEWTEWMNRDDPSGAGDWETAADLLAGRDCTALDIEGEAFKDESGHTLSPPVPAQSTGEVITMSPSVGLICQNADQPDGRCKDYRVRFLCPIAP